MAEARALPSDEVLLAVDWVSQSKSARLRSGFAGSAIRLPELFESESTVLAAREEYGYAEKRQA